MSIPDEGYSGNTTCAEQMFTYIFAHTPTFGLKLYYWSVLQQMTLF